MPMSNCCGKKLYTQIRLFLQKKTHKFRGQLDATWARLKANTENRQNALLVKKDVRKKKQLLFILATNGFPFLSIVFEIMK